LPLPQGHGSFLPIFGVALLIWEGHVPGLSPDSAAAWVVFFGRQARDSPRLFRTSAI
jgi:hypothetical protein